MSSGLKTCTVAVVLLLLTVTAVNDVNAQTTFSMSYFLINDDNAYKSRTAYKEWINTASFMIGRQYSGDNFSVYGFYNGDLSFYSENEDLRNKSHQFGAAGRIIRGDVAMNFGMTGRIRRNEAQYVYYNTDSYNFFASADYKPSLSTSWSLGLTLGKNSFSEFSDIDNSAYSLYTKFRKSFQSRLSLSAECSLGVKDYVNQSVLSFFGYSGMGMNRMPRFVEDPVKSVKFSTSGNIGKSITDNTGISTVFGGSWFVGDPIEAYTDGVYYYTENDLYDDPYSYEHYYGAFYLTQQFSIGFQGKIGVLYQDKNYSGTPALDDAGETLGGSRKDTRTEYTLQLSKKFEMDPGILSSLELFFRFMIRDNQSNDPYYDFADNVGFLGITISR